MKVLYLVNIPSPYRVNFFNELGKLCDLTVLFEHKYSKDREKKWHNNNFNNFNGIFLNESDYKKSNNLWFKVIKYLKNKKYDCIVIGGYSTPTGSFAITYLKYKEIPFVLNVDGGIINYSENKMKYLIKKHFISSANFWLSTGKSTTTYLTYYGADEKKTFIYPFTTLYRSDITKNIINNEKKSFYKNKLNIREKKVIITVGRFIYSKGFDVLLNACRLISSDIGVYIVGGEPTEEYTNLKEKFGLTNVHFIGFKTNKELSEYYLSSDLFILPTRSDVWGLVINEAMSFGLPIITTDKCIAGLELVVDYENGFIVPSDDIIALSTRINEVLNNELLLKSFSKKSYEKIQNYTLENMALITKKSLEDTIIKRKKR